MIRDQKGMTLLLQELSELNNKPELSKRDEQRSAALLASISAVKNGATLAEVDQERLNNLEVEAGFEPTIRYSPLTHEQRQQVAVWQRFIRDGKIESRDMTVGTGVPAYLKGNMGSFVPLEWYKELFIAKKNTDALFDENVVTMVTTTHGRPMQFGYMGDTENVATLVGEAGSLSEQDITSTGGAMLGAYSFKSPVFRASLEAFQDVEIGGSLIDQFNKFSAERIARGVGAYLVNGTGVNQPIGLLTALEALGSAAVVAVGNSGNTGGAQTGANSVGSADVANLFYALDEAYRDSPKCAWLMSSGTLGFLAATVTKQGVPLVQWQGAQGWILGKPVRISPNMPSIGSGNAPIAFGDLSYFVVRRSMDPLTRVQLYKETPGLIENGKFGLRAYCRYDSALQFNDTGSPSPIVYLQNHS